MVTSRTASNPDRIKGKGIQRNIDTAKAVRKEKIVNDFMVDTVYVN